MQASENGILESISKAEHHLYCSGRAYEGHRQFWIEQLNRVEQFSFRQREAYTPTTPAVLRQLSCSLEAELTRNIQARVAGHETGFFVFMLAAWSILLKKYTGLQQVLIESPLYKPALQSAIYEPTVPLILPVEAGRDTRGYLSQIKAIIQEAYEYQNYPLHLIGDTGARYSNICLFMRDLHLPPANKTAYELIVEIEHGDAGLDIILHYNSLYFEPAFIERLTGHLHQALAGLLEPESSIASINILTEPENRQLLETLNQTERDYSEAAFIELFEEQVRKTPQATALLYEDSRWTYRELDAQANAFAASLSGDYGVEPDQVVALCSERSALLIVGMLAVLKTGAAFLPIDRNTPTDRLNYILADAKVGLVLTGNEPDEHYLAIPESSVKSVSLSRIKDLKRQPFHSRVQQDRAAYVIYTSGSTGRPKGVIIRQDSLSNYLQWANAYYFENLPGKNFALFTSIAFDLTITSIFTTLLRGDSLFIYNDRWSINELLTELFTVNTAVNTLKLTPAHISVLNYLPISRTHIQRIITGGDVLTAFQFHTLRKLNPDIRIYNEYGPTETTVGCMVKAVHTESDLLTIGRPIANTRVHILDAEQRLMPIGIFGEICIGGKGVAKGYLNRAELTAEKFIEDKFSTGPGNRLYRSGDYGCRTEDGEIVFAGRKDNQVKIRGYRVELGEIEKVIRSNPAVKEAVVLSVTRTDKEKELVAYYTLQESASVRDLKKFLEEKLPFYMLPSRLMALEAFPITNNGKIDIPTLHRQAEKPDMDPTDYHLPETEEEQLLVETFEKILGRNQIGVEDDFFAIGGDSIKAIQVIAHLYKSGMKLEMATLLQAGTARKAAVFIRPVSRLADQGLTQGTVPLTPIQRHFFVNPRVAYHHFNFGFLFYYRPRFNPEMIRQMIRKLQEHHDVLRMSYEMENGIIKQYNHGADYPLHFEVCDFRAEENAVSLLEQHVNALQGSINLSSGPMLKVALYQLADGDRLAFLLHHLVSDTVSFRIFFEDIGLLMRQYEQGEPIALPLKTDSFQKWARQLQEYANSPVILNERKYWQELCSRSGSNDIPIDYPEGSKLVKHRAVQRISLSEAETHLLLSDIHQTFQTRINDVLLSALAICLKTLYGFTEFRIMMEGHGREDLFPDLNISRTAGYFTIAYPVLLSAYGNNTTEIILENKEKIARIPGNGIGYGILKYLTDKEQSIDFEEEEHPQILFNYFGQVDEDLEHVDFNMAQESVGDIQDPGEQREFELACTSIIAGKIFTLSLEYNSQRFKPERISTILTQYKTALLSVLQACRADKEVSTIIP